MAKSCRSTELRIHGWMCILCGMAMIYPLLRHYLRDVPSLSWPVTQGVVVRSEAGLPRGRGGCQHILQYSYTVRANEYTGSRRTLYDRNYSSDEITAAVSSLPIGTRVAVHYNPDAPASAVLQPGLRDEQWLLHRLGLILLVVVPAFGLGCFWYARRCA
jgi:hypothetical protein